MRIETKRHISNIEKILSCRKWFDRNGIQRVLVDMDGTICDTAIVFNSQMAECCQLMASKNGADLETVTKSMEEANNSLYKKFFVNPNRWNGVVRQLGQEYGLNDQTINQCLEILGGIYTTPLTYMPGSREGLEFLKEVGAPMAVVTHAGRDWTARKYSWLGLDELINWDNAYWINVDGPKGGTEWLEAMKYLGVGPDNCLIIGDSPKSDIESCIGVGVPPNRCVLVEGLNWAVQETQLPEDVWRVKRIDEMVYIGQEEIFRRRVC